MSLDLRDLSPAAKAFWCAAVLLGGAAMGLALVDVFSGSSIAVFQILFGVLFAGLSSRFAVRIRETRISGGAAELFIFLLLLEYGHGAAVLAAVASVAAASWRKHVRWTQRVGRPAVAAVAMFTCAMALHELQRFVPAANHLVPAAAIGLVTVVPVAATFFVLNTLFASLLAANRRNAPARTPRTMRAHAWVCLTYCVAAVIAALLQWILSRYDISVVLAAAPIIAVSHSALHLYVQRLEDRLRREAERAKSAEQAAAGTALHLKELAESEERFQSAFAHAAIGMALVSTDGRILRGNDALASLLGWTEPELIFSRIGHFVHAADIEVLQDALRRTLGGADKAVVAEVRCRHRSGAEVWVSVSGSSFTAKPPLSRCIILQFQDITARRQAEARLQHIAHHDSLTDLANRTCFMERLAEAVSNCAQFPERQFAVLFLDCDRFKLVNDSLGHGAGDALLQGIARRLRGAVGPGDLVARFGGDEFAILIHHADADAEARSLALHLQKVIAEPIHLDGVAISTTASIGITTSTCGYDSPEQVVRDADTAMYRAKRDGKARFLVFDSDLHAEVADRLWIEGALRRAVARRELELRFQPIFDLATRRLTGYEALARWNHPERGAIPPEVFIRIAEETGLIIPLGTWVLTAACEAIGKFASLAGEAAPLSVHVNVSAVQLAQPDFPAVVRRALAAAAIEPRHLIVEVTESVLIDKRSVAVPHLHELREIGVGVSLDDFGTGYSSFSLLYQLPVDEIKIDRSFVEQMVADERGMAVVETMLALGRTLGKVMLAEGIETDVQFERLAAMGCEKGQGFLLGRPLDAIDAAALACEQVVDVDAQPYGGSCAPAEPADEPLAVTLEHAA